MDLLLINPSTPQASTVGVASSHSCEPWDHPGFHYYIDLVHGVLNNLDKGNQKWTLFLIAFFGLTKKQLYLLIFGGDFKLRFESSIVRDQVKKRKDGTRTKSDLLHILGDYIHPDERGSIKDNNDVLEPEQFINGRQYEFKGWFNDHVSYVLEDEDGETIEVFKLRVPSIYQTVILAAGTMVLGTTMFARLTLLDLTSHWEKAFLALKDTAVYQYFYDLDAIKKSFLVCLFLSPLLIQGTRFYHGYKWLRALWLQMGVPAMVCHDFHAKFQEYCKEAFRGGL